MDLAPYSKSRRLTRCITVNAKGEERPRYIEAENYKLWHFLVTNKHDMHIYDEVPCLWLFAGEYSKNSNIYEHAGEIVPVNRLVIDVFDSELGHSTIIERFAHRSEVFTLMNVLHDHLSTTDLDQSTLESAVVPGYAIERRPMQQGSVREMTGPPAFKPTLA